ncbi:MAG TPA: amidohydrolase family protein [Thermoplasmata archaeon]|nr:amidohydrolase family protein [Thermoplasmata archaeon]
MRSSSSPYSPSGSPAGRPESGRAEGTVLAIRNARILPSPDVPPIDRGTVLIKNGKIARVGPDVAVPPTATVIPGDGRVVTAGFWNAHVHFTEPKWRRVRRKFSTLLEAQFHDMFTSRGFTTVVDTGSDPRITLRLRRRIDEGGLLGPKILTAGPGIYPPRGIPYYLRGTIPFYLRPLIPQPTSPRSARWAVRRNVFRGADLIKLFTGSYVERGVVRPMPEAVARAAVEAAHAQDRLVYSHPSNLEGTRIALRAGVDVLAHPPDATDGVDDALLQEMVDRKMAMIPTLKMFEQTGSASRDYLAPIYEVVRRFHARGGEILFGTDVGYMKDYSIEEEIQALSGCGFGPREILRSMTTAPAERFGVGESVGSVVSGARADLVVLDADPFENPLAFTQVRATIRGGRVLHLHP